MKDLFSTQSSDYARFRPTYPPALFAWLAEVAPARDTAVDVGTGNGQAAVALAAHFGRVVALDPSAAQLASATPHPHVEYRCAPAEDTGLPGASADLLAVAQALHWLDHPRFFAEVRRVVRPGGVFAAWGYGFARITPEVDAVTDDLAHVRLGPYWEPERKLVDAGYRTLSFPFQTIEAPAFEMRLDWTLEHLVGYLGTWSSLRTYLGKHPGGDNPLASALPALEQAWGAARSRPVVWPLALHAFRL